MYRLVIAEDDEILLEGLSKGIDWTEMDISVVAAVNDGIYVMDKIKETNADILLTDIRMSKKDGLEVLKELHEQDPDFPVVMLTAYEEFEYVRKALQYGAVDYLLKPVDLVQLNEVMEKAKDRLQEQDKYWKMQWKEMLHQCIQGKYQGKELAGEFSDLVNQFWNMLEIVPNFIANEVPNVEKIILECAQKRGFYSADFKAAHLLIACCAKEGLREKRETFLSEIKQRLWDETGCRITVLIGSEVSHVSELYRSYEDIKRLREYQFCEEFGGTLERKDIRKYENQNNAINKMLLNNIVNAISLGKVEFVPECTRKLKERLRNAGSNSLLNMAYSLSIIYEGLHNKIEKLEMDEIYFQKLYTDVLSCKNLDEAMEKFEKAAVEIAKEVREEQDGSGKTVACKARQYVDERYMQSDLRISEIAKELGISANYLSKLFLEETGTNFSDYLIDVRMKAAQKLLLYSHYTTQEIAQRVGYDNVSYFSVLFKKYTGVTTGQYKKNIRI